MAIVFATKTGNWSDTTVWNTGALPTTADDVYSNTFTVTIDISPTVLSVRNTTATGVTGGGVFTISSNGIVVTLTGAGVISTSAGAITVSVSGANSCSIVGNIAGPTGNSGGVNFTSTGTLNITGNVTAGTGSGSDGIRFTAAGTLNITGNLTGGTNTASGSGINVTSSGVTNVTGTVTGGPVGPGITNSGTANVIGTCQAGSIAAVAGGGSLIATGPFLTNAQGVNPVTILRWFWQNTTPPSTYYQVRSANLAVIRPLYTADSVGGNPAVADVRSGTVYGPSNELTGTCAIPPAASVSGGTPVDNTTGTAALSTASIRSALSAELARMTNAATTQEVADIVEGALQRPAT